MQADVRERIAQLGLEASLNSPEEFAVVIKSDTANWAKVIRAANIKWSDPRDPGEIFRNAR